MTQRYPGIPAPGVGPQSLWRTVLALKHGYETLVGVPKPSDATVVSRADLEALQLKVDRQIAAALGGESIVVQPADVINNNGVANTLQDVTDLEFGVSAGKLYAFTFTFFWSASAANNGSRWSINGPATAQLVYVSAYPSSPGNNADTANHEVAYDLPAAAEADSLNALNMGALVGFIQPSASGNVILRFASEQAGPASITAKAGSYVRYRELL